MKKGTIPLSILITLMLASLVITQAYGQRAQRTGEITKIDAKNKSFVVRTARGETNILTTQDTVFKKGDQDISFEDLKVGDRLRVIGVRKGDNVEAGEVTMHSEQDEQSS